jgi:hypothetical protein
MRASGMREAIMKKLLCLLAIAGTAPVITLAHDDITRADDHAPIGVMGDHYHGEDEVMFSYRYWHMDMEHLQDGTDEINESEVLADYNMAPREMTAVMQSLGIMYAPTDTVTLTAMLPSIKKEMTMVNGMGREMERESSGSGDLKVSTIINPEGSGPWHYQIGVSAPTGSFLEADSTPMGQQRLPYGMQLGSGTWDFLGGATLRGRHDHGSWGVQGKILVRTGENDLGYRLGNEYMATAWAARAFTPWISGSVRLAGKQWDAVHGQDPALNPQMGPGADPDTRGGKRLSAGAGINIRIPDGLLARHRLAVEYLTAVYEDFDGPQLQSDGVLVAGWQYDFKL